MAKVDGSGRDDHTLPDHVAREVLVTDYIDVHDFVALAPRDHVLDYLGIRVRMFDAEINADVVIALALEVVFQIALTLDQQIIIDGTLLKDRHVPLEFSSGDF